MTSYTFHWQYKYQITVYDSVSGGRNTYSSDSLKDIIDIYMDCNSQGMYFRFVRNK